MSENSKIEWTDHTFNPWEGCQKVGPGCDHCYAETRNARFAGGQAINWGPGAPRRRTGGSNWNKPLAWNAAHAEFFAKHGRRQRVFCASLADVFDNAVDPQWRADLFSLIAKTPNLDWLLLTKRIGNVRGMLAELAHPHDQDLTLLDMMPLPNVWIGATIVNQEEADRDIPKLLAVPARVRFLSMEPLLGPVDLRQSLWQCCGSLVPGHPGDGWMQPPDPPECCGFPEPLGKLHWVIVGGESGPGARPMHPAWARSLRDQCAAAGVPFLFKQWGEWKPISEMSEDETNALYRSNRIAQEHENQDALDEIYGRSCRVVTDGIGFGGARGHDAFWVVDGKGGMQMFKVGKKAAGRLLDARTWDEVPATTGDTK